MCTFEEEEDACARWHHAPTDSIMCVCVRGPGKKIMTHTETSMMTFFYFFIFLFCRGPGAEENHDPQLKHLVVCPAIILPKKKQEKFKKSTKRKKENNDP